MNCGRDRINNALGAMNHAKHDIRYTPSVTSVDKDISLLYFRSRLNGNASLTIYISVPIYFQN